MDKLTLDHLSPFLPYGVEVITEDGIFKVVGWVDDIGICLDTIFYGANAIPEYKLILRPLSDLTKEIEHNGERFTPNNRIDQYTQIGGDGKLYLLVDGALWSCNPLSWDYYLVVKLISWHFDVFGLIGKGLAIDYNTVKGGPNEI